MPTRTPPRNLLLVEGTDDREAVYQLLNFEQIPQDQYSVKAKVGYESLVRDLKGEIKASELERLGILVDADFDLASRWQSICNHLREIGYDEVPPQPVPGGTIIRKAARLWIGIWVMPDNTLPGMLEDFAAYLVPAGDTLWEYAGQCVNYVVENNCRFPTHHAIKAQIHTWLAWQEEPGRPIGLAIKMRYLDTAVPQAQQFIAWLRQLFNL